MDENYKNNSSPNQNPNDLSPGRALVRNPIVLIILTPLVLCLLAVLAYSIYVAVHEPDAQETVVLGQTRLAAGSPAAFRIMVRNRHSGRPVKGAEVKLSLRSKALSIKLGAFRTDSSGSLADAVSIPDLAPGEYELVIESASSLGRDRIIRKIEVQHPARVLLSSDKPIYQPGQVVHLRSLILNDRTQKPFAGETIIFEVSDPKGNKVFKESHKASTFGIASADFVLATEVNLGRYQIRAVAGAACTERTVEVKRYVLPKFKIHLATDQPYYLPGQTVSGSAQANYFFGRPVSGGTVKLSAVTLQEKPVVVAELQGRTDAAGKYSFNFVLPDFFIGLPLKNEQAFLDLRAELRDTAGHTEETTLSLSVARNELEVTVIPEAGTLVPGVENLFYVVTAYPDGRPAQCRVFLNGTAYPSDERGVTQVRLGPDDANRQIELQAIDSAGRKATRTYRPEANAPVPAFLLRTDKAVYRAGEVAKITLLSPEKQNTVFIDVIKDNQTVLTRSEAIQNHTASCALTLPASLVGPVKLNAYVITGTGEDRGCCRIICVNPASGLQIATSLSKAVYRPGEVARLDFTITDSQGRSAPAALGIAAVDESVFALHENRPGLLQQFLNVENELLKPRYEIKSFACPQRFLFESSGNQVLAQAYFASLEHQSSGPSIDELVKCGYISQRSVDHARGLRGTPAYERLRRDPQYAEVMRLLEGTRGIYSLREATGPVKLQATEAHRKAYFDRLKEYLGSGALGLLFFSPIFLLFYYARPGGGGSMAPGVGAQIRRYVQLASSTYNVLGVITLLPVICYPCGSLILGPATRQDPGWVLLGIESAIVLTTLMWQLSRLRREEDQQHIAEMGPLRAFVVAFLIQFLVSRAGIARLLAAPSSWGDGFTLLWFLGSIVAPLVVLAGLGSHAQRQLLKRGIPPQPVGSRLIEVLVVIALLAIFGAMLLPALAKAKARGMAISLLSDLRQLDLANRTAEKDEKPEPGNSPIPHVRRDFPETLLWRPELITDDHGQASLEIPLADSITTWRASVEGISSSGKLGNAEVPIPVFQDFFVDLDLPVSLSLGDQVSVPLTCYNYLKRPQDIRLTVASANWFESRAQNLSVHLDPNAVKSISFPLKVLRAGNHLLRVSAQGGETADAVEREVRVLPTGRKIEHTENGILKENWSDTFTIASGAFPESESLWAKFYPSRFSEIVEGLESIFQAPNGCFEQTSSTTYPNVLVLDYLKRMGRLSPEIEIKARKFINAGYQRLLTFEVPGGGFEWFGHSPAHVGLTAYGILEFTDMAQVHPVDPALTDRTRQWLFSKQNPNGSWSQVDGLHAWSSQTPVTAYVAWALAESGDQSPNLDRALDYLRSHPEERASTYQKALAANAFLARDRNDALGRGLAKELNDASLRDGKKRLHWKSRDRSITDSYGAGMDVETTALSAMALMKAGLWPESVKQALSWLSACKTANGTWGSTQATILAMRALLAGSTAALGQEFDSAITLLLNGEAVETFHLNKANSDVLKVVDLTRHLRAGENHIEFRQVPAGELPFQLAGEYWLPAGISGKASNDLEPVRSELLQIDAAYDRTTLPVNEELPCAVTVKNHAGQVINMAIVDLGIPPGFDVDAAAFAALQEEGRIAKFEITGNQVILYLREISNQQPFQFRYTLRAKYPLRVQAPPSAVYEYYQPKNRAQTKSVILEARSQL